MKTVIYIATVLNLVVLFFVVNNYLDEPVITYVHEWVHFIWVLAAPVCFFMLINFYLYMVIAKKSIYNRTGNLKRFFFYLNLFIAFALCLLIFVNFPQVD